MSDLTYIEQLKCELAEARERWANAKDANMRLCEEKARTIAGFCGICQSISGVYYSICDDCVTERNRVIAENKRLREALEKCRSAFDNTDENVAGIVYSGGGVYEIIQTALQPTPAADGGHEGERVMSVIDANDPPLGKAFHRIFHEISERFDVPCDDVGEIIDLWEARKQEALDGEI